MHALVFRFVHQRADPPPVVAHAAQALQVVDRRADHSRHSRDRFEHDCTMTIALGKEGIGAEAQRFRKAISDAVGHALGVVMDAKVDNRSIHCTLHSRTTAPPGPGLGLGRVAIRRRELQTTTR
jgi:hypothetical protein